MNESVCLYTSVQVHSNMSSNIHIHTHTIAKDNRDVKYAYSKPPAFVSLSYFAQVQE